MPNEKEEQPLIEPKGTEGLTFKGFNAPEKEAEKTSAGDGQDEQEDILTLEEMKQRFPKLKVKMSVAGEEKILAPEELGQHYQLTHGRERTIEQRNAESARLQDELRQLRAEILGMRGTVEQSKVETPPADQDDPGVFVDTRATSLIDTKVTPQIAALNRKVDALLEAVEPTIEDSQIKRAKMILSKQGIDISGFDKYRQTRLKTIAAEVGRDLTPKEIANVSGERWVIDYSLAVASGRVKPKEAETEEEAPEKPPTRRTVKVTTVGAGGGSGGGGYKPPTGSTDQSLEDAKRTGNFAPHLLRKGIRPYGSEQGG